jgi:hypothetical protein
MKAGLSQEAVALKMGLKLPAGMAQVSKIESGWYRSGPSIVRVLDFLRACGARPCDLLDILDRHTAEWTAREEQTFQQVEEAIKDMPAKYRRRAFYYAVGLRFSARQAVRNATEASRRVRQVVARGRAEELERRLRQVFKSEMNALALAPSHALAFKLRTFGRMVFAALRRTRSSKPVWRNRALARLDEWPLRWGDDPAPFQRMKAAVTGLFRQMDEAGELG